MRARSASRSSKRRFICLVNWSIRKRKNAATASANATALLSRNRQVCQKTGLPFVIATAITPAPSLGRKSMIACGRYPGSTSRAAYSVPKCIEFLHFESGWILVKGWSTSGCTHQDPDRAKRTIRCPGRAPVTRPSMVSSLSGPPSPARGILVNSMEGGGTPCRERQPLRTMQRRRRRALSRARWSKRVTAAVFSFERSNRRRQTRLRQAVKRVNPILCGAVSPVRAKSNS
jgi:hypothetical protein